VQPHASGDGLLEDAIGGHRVEVKMHIDAAAKKLWAPDGSGLGAGDAGEPLGHARNLFSEDAIHRAEHVGLAHRKSPKLPRQRQDPLPDRHVGKDLMYGSLPPASRATTRA